MDEKRGFGEAVTRARSLSFSQQLTRGAQRQALRFDVETLFIDSKPMSATAVEIDIAGTAAEYDVIGGLSLMQSEPIYMGQHAHLRLAWLHCVIIMLSRISCLLCIVQVSRSRPPFFPCVDSFFCRQERMYIVTNGRRAASSVNLSNANLQVCTVMCGNSSLERSCLCYRHHSFVGCVIEMTVSACIQATVCRV
jgi:hypothetical protein